MLSRFRLGQFQSIRRVSNILFLIWALSGHGAVEAGSFDEEINALRVLRLDTVDFIKGWEAALGSTESAKKWQRDSADFNAEQLIFLERTDLGVFFGFWGAQSGHMLAGRGQHVLPSPSLFFKQEVKTLKGLEDSIRKLEFAADQRNVFDEACARALLEEFPAKAAALKASRVQVHEGLLKAREHWRAQVVLKMQKNGSQKARIAAAQEAAALSFSDTKAAARLRTQAAKLQADENRQQKKIDFLGAQLRGELGKIAGAVETPIFELPPDDLEKKYDRLAARQNAIQNLLVFTQQTVLLEKNQEEPVRKIANAYAVAFDNYARALNVRPSDLAKEAEFFLGILTTMSAGTLSWLSSAAQVGTSTAAANILMNGLEDATQAGLSEFFDIIGDKFQPELELKPGILPQIVQNNLEGFLSELSKEVASYILSVTKKTPSAQSCFWDHFDAEVQRRGHEAWLAASPLAFTPKIPNSTELQIAFEKALWAGWVQRNYVCCRGGTIAGLGVGPQGGNNYIKLGRSVRNRMDELGIIEEAGYGWTGINGNLNRLLTMWLGYEDEMFFRPKIYLWGTEYQAPSFEDLLKRE